MVSKRVWTTSLILALAASAACSKKKDKDDDDSSDTTVATSGGGTIGGVGVTPPGTLSPSTLTLSGKLSLTSSAGAGLTEETGLAGLYVKAMTADLNAATCIDDVDLTDGSYSMSCAGFQGKILIVAVLKIDADGTSQLLAIKTIGGIGGQTDAASLSLTLDPETGTLSAGDLAQTAVGTAVDASKIVVAQPEALASLAIDSGYYDFKKTSIDGDEAKKLIRAGDYSGLPSAEDRANTGWSEKQYVRFYASNGFTAPHLELWTSEDKAVACDAGYSISDGTNTFGDLTFDATLAAIKANGWAPRAALDRYFVSQSSDDGEKHGFAAQSGRMLVEEFFRRLSEARYMRAPDDRYEKIQTAYSDLTRESAAGAVSDETLKTIGAAWAEISWNQESRELLELAVKKFDQTDLVRLGGTGKIYLQNAVKSLITYGEIGDLIVSIYNYDYYNATKEQHLDFATRWKAVNVDATIEGQLDNIIIKLNDASTTIQAQGSTAIRAMVMELQSAGNLVQYACSSSWNIDFAPVFSDASGLAAFNVLAGKVEFRDYSTPDSTTRLKTGVTDSARSILNAFIGTAAPIIGGCGKINLKSNLAHTNQATYWDHQTQQYVALSDAQRDENALEALEQLSYQLGDAQRRLALFSINVRDPNGDSIALVSASGVENSAFSLANAEADLTALADDVKALIGVGKHHYSWLCWDLASLGIDVSDVDTCTAANFGSYQVDGNSYAKLFRLQDRVSEMVAREAYFSDPAFQAVLRKLSLNSACPADVFVGWDHETAADGAQAFPLEIGGPVHRLMAGDVTFVQKPDGTASLFVDGSRLRAEKSYDSESETETDCVRGEVKAWRDLILDGTVLKEFAFEEGWKDTCYNSGSDYVSLFYVDATKAAADE